MRPALKCSLAAALAALMLAGCGALPEDGPSAPEKDHYYQILDADGAELYTVAAKDAVEEIDGAIDAVGLERGWTGGGEGAALYTYVFWQEETRLAGEDPGAERPYAELLRITVRADSDVVTTEVSAPALEALADALPQLEGVLTFSAEAPPETAAALRDPARFAEA